MADERFQRTTPVGRLVQGSPFEAQTKDFYGKPFPDGKVKYYIGIAVPKDSPEWNGFWADVHRIAREGFPRLFNAQGTLIAKEFHWKIEDGDLDDKNREGFKGHWIVKMSTGFAPRCFKRNAQTGAMEQLVNPESVKRGHWIRVLVNIAPNGEDAKPGLFINPSLVEHVYFGEEIVSGPDPNEAFGAPADNGYIPAGASATPVGSSGPSVAGPGGGPGATEPPPVSGGPGGPGGVQPDHDFLNGHPGVGQTPPPPPPPPPPADTGGAPAGYRMTAKAEGRKYQAYVQASWSNDQMLASGVMEPWTGDDVPF